MTDAVMDLVQYSGVIFDFNGMLAHAIETLRRIGWDLEAND